MFKIDGYFIPMTEVSLVMIMMSVLYIIVVQDVAFSDNNIISDRFGDTPIKGVKI